jgi:hypothetical protein
VCLFPQPGSGAVVFFFFQKELPFSRGHKQKGEFILSYLIPCKCVDHPLGEWGGPETSGWVFRSTVYTHGIDSAAAATLASVTKRPASAPLKRAGRMVRRASAARQPRGRAACVHSSPPAAATMALPALAPAIISTKAFGALSTPE